MFYQLKVYANAFHGFNKQITNSLSHWPSFCYVFCLFRFVVCIYCTHFLLWCFSTDSSLVMKNYKGLGAWVAQCGKDKVNENDTNW